MNSKKSLPGFGDPCLIVAEIGQNHQGDLATAKLLIREAKMSGADCVKFQKTCLEEKFAASMLNQVYDGPNSWGETYGDHKKFLEFSEEEFVELKKYSESIGITFFATAMDHISADVLARIKVPFLKIGSGDSNNLPLIEYTASKRIPLIISTGMIDKNAVENIYKTVKKHHNDFCLLHCVSSYPTPFEDCNLNVLKDYQKSFPDIPIGYSGHELGITVSLAAVALGAKIIERHLTLDKDQKGSDHRCSLLPVEMKEMITQIRIIEKALGSPLKQIQNSERACIAKLQKCLVTSRAISKGAVLSRDDMRIKVAEPKGVDAALFSATVGKTIRVDKSKDEPIFETDFII